MFRINLCRFATSWWKYRSTFFWFSKTKVVAVYWMNSRNMGYAQLKMNVWEKELHREYRTFVNLWNFAYWYKTSNPTTQTCLEWSQIRVNTDTCKYRHMHSHTDRSTYTHTCMNIMQFNLHSFWAYLIKVSKSFIGWCCSNHSGWWRGVVPFLLNAFNHPIVWHSYLRVIYYIVSCGT